MLNVQIKQVSELISYRTHLYSRPTHIRTYMGPNLVWICENSVYVKPFSKIVDCESEITATAKN